jgi:hypothetical protein
MKAIVCEMCNSNDVIKQDGLYVCQCCGTKYSPEEAKKLLVELSGTVDVSGSTVKIDHSGLADNYLLLARRAAEEGNDEKAAKYYELLAVNRPNSWEANFYSVYHQACMCEADQIADAAYKVANSIPNTLRLIRSEVPEADQKEAYTEVAENVSTLREELYRQAAEHYLGSASWDNAESAFAETRFYLYRMETELASALWEEFGARELAMEHLRLCDTEQSNMSWESLHRLMEKIAPEEAEEAAETHQSEQRSKRLRKLAGAVIPLALGIILFFVGTQVDPPLRGILEVLGVVSGVGGLVWAVSQAVNKVF